MKTQIRSGVFETNSSSIHSIAIRRGTRELGINTVICSGGAIAFKLGEFGWSAKKYSSVENRASYLWTMACSDTKKDADQREKFIRETLAELDIRCVFEPVVRKVYSDFEYECCEKEDGGNFYIDHSDSWDYFKEKIFSDKDLLLDYLFGDSCVLTYNDNDDYDYWLYSVDDGTSRETYTKGN